MSIRTKMVAIFATSRCTLNCKYCGTAIPKVKAAGITYNADINQVKACIDSLFEVYDHIEHIDFTGGEALLWNGLGECLSYASKYKDKFSFLRVLTNGTLLPPASLISTIKSLDYPFDFFIDNYGTLSCKVAELREMLSANNIPYRETLYDGNNQDFGGWIDFGDMEFKGYNSTQLQCVYDNCLQAHHMCLTVFDGKVYNCAVAPMVALLGKVSEEGSREFIPLLDSTVTLDEKQQIAEQFGRQVLTACQYCKGFDSKNAERFPAAEQL